MLMVGLLKFASIRRGQRARGRRRGWPSELGGEQRALAIDLHHQKKFGIDEICRTLEITKPILYSYVRGASK
jgi:hypothetical protein